MDDGRIDPPEVIGERLRILRVSQGYAKNQSGFAKLCDISPQTWNNWEKGKRTPSGEEASKIRYRTKVTYDWIYHGDDSGLPMKLARQLQDAAVALSTG